MKFLNNHAGVIAAVAVVAVAFLAYKLGVFGSKEEKTA